MLILSLVPSFGVSRLDRSELLTDYDASISSTRYYMGVVLDEPYLCRLSTDLTGFLIFVPNVFIDGLVPLNM